MVTSAIKRLPKSTVELEITIPWSEIETTYSKVFDTVVENSELPGFRKGKAPKELVREKVDKTKIYEEVMKQVIPKAYAEVLKSHDVKPIISPRVEILEAKENADWKVKATVAEKPEVNLKQYKTAVAQAKSSVAKLWIPGQSDQKEKKEDTDQARLDRVVKALLEEVEIELPEMLIQEEANRLLSRLIDQTQKLGLTVEQYLAAQGKTSDQIRAEYAQQAEKTLKLEFILEAVAEAEKIMVTPEEIEKMLETVKDEEEKKKLHANSYYLATLLRQQKTLDVLSKPVV